MPKLLIIIIFLVFIGMIVPFISGAHWAFYLYQFIYFLNPEARWWGGNIPSWPYSKISVLILISLFIFKYQDFKTNKLTQLTNFKWFILLLITYSITYFYAQSQTLHLEALNNFFKLLIIIALAYKVLDSQKKLELALLAFSIGCFYLSYETYTVGRNSGDRVEGIGLIDAPDSNGTSAAIAPIIPILIFYFWQANNKIKFIIVIAGAFIANALVLINSRGAFAGTFVGTMYLFKEMYFSSFKTKYQKSIVILLIILGLAGLLIIVDQSFIERMLTLTTVADEEGKSGSHRYHMWISTFDLLKDYPFGTGAYGYELLSQIYVDPSLFFAGQQQKAVHSIWFQALAEVGWIGFFFFMMLIISTFTMINKVITYSRNKDIYQYYLAISLKASFITSLVAGSFINNFRVQIPYWCILFISCLYSIIIKNDSVNNKNDNHNK